MALTALQTLSTSKYAFASRLNRIFLSALLIGLAGFSVYCYYSWQHERDNLLDSLSLQARFTAASSQALFDDIGNDLQLAGLHLREKSDVGHLRPEFETIIRQRPEVANIAVFDTGGDLLYTHYFIRRKTLYNIRQFGPVYQNLLKDFRSTVPYVIGENELGPMLGKWRFPIRHVVRDRQGRPAFVLQASIPVERQTAFWAGLNLMPGTAIGLYRNESDRMMARWPDFNPDATYTRDYSKLPLRQSLNLNPERGYYQGITGTDGTDRIGAYVRLSHLPLTAFVSVPEATVGRLWWKHNQAAVLAFGGLFLFFAVFAFVLLRREKLHGQHLIDQALTDLLTGLPNRAAIVDHLRREAERADKAGRRFTVLFIDLDRLKVVNDSLGHASGDSLIQEAARRLKAGLASGDFLGRLGGDEFLAVTDCETEEMAGRVAQRLQDALRPPFAIDGRQFSLSLSIGVALYPEHGQSGADVVSHADMAMYAVKNNGGNGIAVFHESMAGQALARLEMQEQLRQALDNDELVLHYQPKFDQSGRVSGAEALVRWQHPERGLLMPGAFISVAEESSLIVELGEWVLRTACRQAARWATAGRPVRIAVNIAARQFEQPHFIDLVRSVLSATPLPPHLLEIELTESMLAGDLQSLRGRLEALTSLGVRIALDDFGTGYSSLAYLKQLPIHTLKIDRSFVKDLGADANDAEITSAIIAMSQRLKLKVVAEGVETEQQLAFLMVHNCDEFQGYLFSKPLPVERMDRLLQSREEGTTPGPALTDGQAQPPVR